MVELPGGWKPQQQVPNLPSALSHHATQCKRWAALQVCLRLGLPGCIKEQHVPSITSLVLPPIGNAKEIWFPRDSIGHG
ncbi:MAG: hypothetical protein D6755_04440 [Anaerolineae bacterium]|nr:MAG: hypothetical protein D6755_04440 [Anaerolineae bacterium]